MSRLIKQLAFRELEAAVPNLTKLSVTIGAAAGNAGAANTRHFVRRFLPSIRFHNPEATISVQKKSEPGTKSSIEAAFGSNMGSKVFDPTAAKDVELFAALLGKEAPPAAALAPLYSAAGPAADAAAPADAGKAGAAPTDAFAAAILKAAKGSYRVHGSAGQGEYLYNKKKWGRKRAKLGLPPLKGRAGTGAGSSKA